MAGEFQLGGIVPWGRSAAEYEAFFDLSPATPPGRVLDCGGGPASFAAEWGERGIFTVAADPLYAGPTDDIAIGFEPIAARMLEGMRTARSRFDWSLYGSPEAVVERRREALATFVADRSSPSGAGRYVAAALPRLPFPSGTFDLVLSSHLLFLYSDEIGVDEHVAAIREMLRVGREVRIFPLLDLHGRPSAHLDPVTTVIGPEAVSEVRPVPFEFQRGASSMLRLSSR